MEKAGTTEHLESLGKRYNDQESGCFNRDITGKTNRKLRTHPAH